MRLCYSLFALLLWAVLVAAERPLALLRRCLGGQAQVVAPLTSLAAVCGAILFRRSFHAEDRALYSRTLACPMRTFWVRSISRLRSICVRGSTRALSVAVTPTATCGPPPAPRPAAEPNGAPPCLDAIEPAKRQVLGRQQVPERHPAILRAGSHFRRWGAAQPVSAALILTWSLLPLRFAGRATMDLLPTRQSSGSEAAAASLSDNQLLAADTASLTADQLDRRHHLLRHRCGQALLGMRPAPPPAVQSRLCLPTWPLLFT